MTARRTVRVVATGARLLIGVVLAVACVAGVVGAVAIPWPELQQTPAAVQVTPLPGNTVLACSGPVRALGRNSQSADQMQSAGIPEVTVAGSGSEPEPATLATPELEGADGAPMFTGVVDGRQVSLAAAAESIALGAEDLSGFAAAACREPRAEAWLVGGAATTGTSDVLLISNPGDVTATVTLTVYPAEGTSSTLLVPARTQVAVPLAANAVGVTSPVVHVSALGAPVRAMLQSALMRTLDPVGIDMQDSAASPDTRVVVAGVQVVAQAGDAPTTLLRMLAPESDTEAQVTVRPAGSSDAVGQRYTVPLSAGIPAEIDLAGLARGTYSVEVEASAPLVAAAWQSTGTGPGADFAWTPSAPTILGDVLVAVPRGPSARVHLVNDGDSDAVVSFGRVDSGAPEQVTIPAGGSVLVDVRNDAAYALGTSTPIRAAVVMSGTGALAGWPVWPGEGAREPITVYP